MKRLVVLFGLTLLTVACSNQDLTEREFILQNQASEVVADVLFDRDLRLLII